LSASVSHPLLEERATALSLAEAAASLGVPLPTLRNWMGRGVRGVKLETFHIGGRRFVRPADLARFLDATQGEGRNA
jgi:hypothetical protein